MYRKRFCLLARVGDNFLILSVEDERKHKTRPLEEFHLLSFCVQDSSHTLHPPHQIPDECFAVILTSGRCDCICKSVSGRDRKTLNSS